MTQKEIEILNKYFYENGLLTKTFTPQKLLFKKN